MSAQPPRPDPPEAAAPPPAPPVPKSSPETDHDDLLGGHVPPTDDTPTIISKAPPKTSQTLFSGLLSGRKLAHFELIEPIGVGGMAAVLRARDTQLERFVALKILPPEMSGDPENVARFHQEARAAARLDHETIARVFYCGEDQNLHFIAFEFVEGENLRTAIDRRGPLPVPEALHYLLQIATGLQHAAERGVVHRDIKPSNIIISPNGRAKLVDMGLARNLGPHSDDGLTQSGVTLGTFDYISPEQALEPRDADVRSDIYSLGCTFYHALTGQAPVPEGTAARKLHHHQHVPPIDPRQLNPDIPDEVAAILGRMMAKDPKHRYQRPEHLVQHLLQATHRLAPGSEAPDGVLFVDAALPAPPRARPLLVAGCAAAIVVVLVFMIGRSQDGRPGPLGDPFTPAKPSEDVANVLPQGPGAQAGNMVGKGGGLKSDPAIPEAEKPILFTDVPSKLRDFSQTTTKEKRYVITLTANGDLGPGAETTDATPIVLRGKSIELRGDAGAPARPTIWCPFVPTGEPAPLVLDADEVRLENLRFVADPKLNAPGPGLWAAGVLLKTAGQVTVRDCEFWQGNVQTGSLFNALALDTRSAGLHSVQFERCCFLGGKEVRRPSSGDQGWLTEVGKTGGQTAVAVRGTATVKASNCAFGPHAALFHFFDAPTGKSSLTLDQCTALAGDEWALAAIDDGPLAVAASHSFFGRIGASPDAMTMMGRRKPVACLVRLGPKASSESYTGTSNCYQNLDAVSIAAADDLAPGPDMFAKQLLDLANGNPKSTEERVLPADTHPFKADPIALLQGPLTRQDLLAAFSLDFLRVADLRYGSGAQAAIVGVADSPWGRAWPSPLPPTGAALVKVVDPKKETDTANGIYKTLQTALSEPNPNDIIEIRTDEVLPVQQLPILKNGVILTIRPASGSHPVLVLGDTKEKQAALFRVDGGQLNLVNLEFRLAPVAPDSKNPGFDWQTVALVFAEGSVHFTGCRITLDGQEVPLAAVTLADPAKGAMMQPGAAGKPKIVFDSCFLRGSGDLVSAKASRPFDLDVNDSLVALDGSLLNVDAGGKDTPPPSTRDMVEVRVNQSTAYLGGHLVKLRAASMGSLLPVHCNPVRSLFVSAADAEHRKALLHIEAGPADGAGGDVRAHLPWQGNENNYANFSTKLDQQAGDREFPRSMENEKWKENDMGSKSDNVTFTGSLWPDGDVMPATASPGDFELKMGPPGLGVRIKMLPPPAGDR